MPYPLLNKSAVGSLIVAHQADDETSFSVQQVGVSLRKLRYGAIWWASFRGWLRWLRLVDAATVGS